MNQIDLAVPLDGEQGCADHDLSGTGQAANSVVGPIGYPWVVKSRRPPTGLPRLASDKRRMSQLGPIGRHRVT